jgi:Flp pilus assembly protein TadB
VEEENRRALARQMHERDKMIEDQRARKEIQVWLHLCLYYEIVHIWIYICIYICIYMYIYIYIFVYICIFICMYVYIYRSKSQKRNTGLVIFMFIL